MPSLPCSLWPIRQTRLAPSVRSDSDRTEASTGGPMAAPAPVWRTARVCPADPLALSHPQASLGQSQGCRGEVSEESWRLIGDGLTDWMTEELDFSSYLPNPPSPPSSAGASLPPSPRHNDIQVPSDLEVMTSLLQEELAQLEDYFLSEPLAERRLGKCERLPPPPPPGPQLFATPPYASHPPPAQPESNPLLVTLATGELDLLSICGGSVGRSKLPRHAAYSCGRPGPYARKRAAEGGRFDGVASAAKGSDSGNGAALLGYYGSAGDEQLAAKSFCLGNAADARRCEKNLGFSQDVMSGAKGGGFGFGGSPDAPQKKVEVVTYGVRDESGGELLSSINASAEVTKAAVSWKADAGDGGCYLTAAPQCDAFSSFLGNVGEQVKTESLRMAPPPPGLHCGYPEEPLPECFLRAREGLNLDGAGLRQACCTVKYEVELPPHQGGVRKQKKRDQNKTAAHRYRQRKRAELDSLEDQLHGLEGRNRELRDKAESVEREIQYVKDLLIEVYKARSQRLRQDATA